MKRSLLDRVEADDLAQAVGQRVCYGGGLCLFVSLAAAHRKREQGA